MPGFNQSQDSSWRRRKDKMKSLDSMGGSEKPAVEVEIKAPDESDMSESEDAASDILAALGSKDAKALDLALQRHYAVCEGMGHSEGGSDEEA